jgi:octaprenyl-diphosphate synthase
MSEKLASDDLLSRVQEFLGDDLEAVEEIFHSELESRFASVADVLTHVTRFRGKRLRPMLLLLSAAAAGKINRNHRTLAAVVEMIHTATLVHDDILDDADTRRHVATVNSRWNNETSVLFGDFLFTHAFHLAASLASTFACRAIGRATNVVCEGEIQQVHERGNFDLNEADYLEIISAKTGELCAVSCLLGAYYCDADESVVQSLEQYGRQLGIAFQISDDLLDILGNEDVTGKSLGSDLDKQKLTLPLICLLQQSSEPETTRIRALLSHPDEASRRKLRSLLEQTDALEYAQRRADEFAAGARQCLESLPDTPARRILESIAEFATHRAY